jgi:hypothetical protein
MATIAQLLRLNGSAFNEDATLAMGEAFDAACALLGNIGDLARENVAYRIIDAATEGERDPARLRDAGVIGLKPI